MIEAKFTEGPWKCGKVDKNDPRYFIGPNPDKLKIVATTSMGNDAANAHMLAAAPDMYAALTEISRFLDGWCPTTCTCARDSKEIHERIIKAIKKAEGK